LLHTKDKEKVQQSISNVRFVNPNTPHLLLQNHGQSDLPKETDEFEIEFMTLAGVRGDEGAGASLSRLFYSLCDLEREVGDCEPEGSNGGHDKGTGQEPEEEETAKHQETTLDDGNTSTCYLG
jgi:hypothetical protein